MEKTLPWSQIHSSMMITMPWNLDFKVLEKNGWKKVDADFYEKETNGVKLGVTDMQELGLNFQIDFDEPNFYKAFAKMQGLLVSLINDITPALKAMKGE